MAKDKAVEDEKEEKKMKHWPVEVMEVADEIVQKATGKIYKRYGFWPVSKEDVVQELWLKTTQIVHGLFKKRREVVEDSTQLRKYLMRSLPGAIHDMCKTWYKVPTVSLDVLLGYDEE